MRETILGNHIRKVPSVAVGCMRLSEKSKDEMNHFIHAALEQGAYFFDHADIYGGGAKPVTEAADVQFIARGRRAFCRPVKVSGNGCWRYQKCEC